MLRFSQLRMVMMMERQNLIEQNAAATGRLICFLLAASHLAMLALIGGKLFFAGLCAAILSAVCGYFSDFMAVMTRDGGASPNFSAGFAIASILLGAIAFVALVIAYAIS